MRILCDTNVFVSALVFGGKPGRVLEFARNSAVLVVSEPLLQELRRILTSKFGWTHDRALGVMREVALTSELVSPTIKITACRDPDDNRILEAAVDGHADIIVSGDADLLSMASFRGVHIVSVAEFLARLDPGETT